MRSLLIPSFAVLLALGACSADTQSGGSHVSPPAGSSTLNSGSGSSDTSRTSDFLTGRSRSGPIGSTTATDSAPVP